MNFSHKALVLLLFLSFGGALAAPLGDLYETEIPVADQGPETRRMGLAAAFEQVLAKVAGSRRVTEDPVLARAAPESYLQHYRYRLAEDGHLALRARFSPEAVDRLLKSRPIPLLGTPRPALLVWLVVGEGRGARMATGEERHLLERLAEERGVALLWPQSGEVPFAGAPPYDDRAMLDLSRRYGAAGGAVVRIDGVAGALRGRWAVEVGSGQRRWEGSGTLQEMLTAGVEQLSEQIYLQFARTSTGEREWPVRLRVEGVDDFRSYSRASDQLGKTEGIGKATLMELSGGGALFQLLARDELAKLRHSLEESGLFAEMDPSLPPSGEGIPMVTLRLTR